MMFRQYRASAAAAGADMRMTADAASMGAGRPKDISQQRATRRHGIGELPFA